MKKQNMKFTRYLDSMQVRRITRLCSYVTYVGIYLYTITYCIRMANRFGIDAGVTANCAHSNMANEIK